MLKQLLQLLLNTRTTPEEAAHSALRDTSSPTEIFTGSQTYTAPSDGLVTVYGKSTETGGSAIGLTYNNQPYFYRTFQSVKGWQQAVTAPVSKGETISVVLYNLTEVSVKFFKTFGGGYNNLVRRALSCLRALSNFSQRSFCKVKSLGFLNSVLRLSAMAQTFLAQAPRTSLAMLHRATAGRLLGAIQAQSQLLKFKSIMGKWHLLPSSTETPLGVVSTVTSKKEPLLNSYAEAETHRIIPFGSTKQVQTLNLLSTGGALC